MTQCSGIADLRSASRDAQRAISHELAAGARWALQSGCSEADRRRLVSSAGHGATAWLRAIPTRHSLQLSNIHFACALQFFLHLPIAMLCAAPALCKCCAGGATADCFGEHDLGPCKRHKRLVRHNEILDALIAAAKQVGISASRSNVLAYLRTDPDDRSYGVRTGVF